MSARVADEPAFVLHRYDWSETSLVLEVFTRHHGRLALVAKGVKRPTSQYRSVLLPLQPLQLSWTGEAEVRSLRAAQWSGGHVMPTGEALVTGAYLNELVLRLLARDDPHARLFDHYATAVQLLAERPETQTPLVRVFELLLLRETGLLPDLSRDAHTLEPLAPHGRYALQAESGLRAAHDDDHHALATAQWLALYYALQQDEPFVPLLRACVDSASALRIPLRNLLHYHGGVRVFRTRQLLLDVQALRRRHEAPGNAARET